MEMTKLQMIAGQVMNNKVAIFSDLHLGVHQNSSFWLDISISWVKWFKDDIVSKGIKDVIFCGDFFHYRDEVSLISLDAGNKILDILKDLNVYMITGNHDCYYKETSEINSLSVFKGRNNIKVFDSITSLNIHGKQMLFCPWGAKIATLPVSDIIFGHFELQNFKMNAFKICGDGDDPGVLSTKAPLIFSGHFHLRDEKIYNNSTIVYVGNPFEMDFGDSEQIKGYHILDISASKYTFIESNFTPKHIKLLLSNLITTKDADELFRKIIYNNIIKLVIDKNISTEHLDILVAKITGFKPSDIRIDYDVNYNKIKIDANESLDLSGVIIEQAIEEFINLLDITNKKEVIDYTVGLYNRSKL